MKPRHTLRWIERSLWIAGIVLLGWVGLVWADGQIYQSRAEERLEHALRAGPAASAPAADLPPRELPGDRADEPAEADAPADAADAASGEAASPAAQPARQEPGLSDDLLGRLEIPRLDVSVMVSRGTSARVLRRGAGYITTTALPGDSGNVGIAGHRDRHFRPLKDVGPGDEVLLTTVDGTFRYRVSWTRVVEPRDVYVLRPTEEPTLTLVTCYPFYFVGNAPDRFIVRAHQIGWQPPA